MRIKVNEADIYKVAILADSCKTLARIALTYSKGDVDRAIEYIKENKSKTDKDRY